MQIGIFKKADAYIVMKSDAEGWKKCAGPFLTYEEAEIMADLLQREKLIEEAKAIPVKIYGETEKPTVPEIGAYVEVPPRRIGPRKNQTFWDWIKYGSGPYPSSCA